ncbi:MAG: hypothetical protein ACRCVX_03825 [Shewanella sp.]
MKMLTFDQLLEALRPMRITAHQWAQLNYAVSLDEESELWVSKSPDDIGDELYQQAVQVKRCLSEPQHDEPPYMSATIGASDQPRGVFA